MKRQARKMQLSPTAKRFLRLVKAVDRYMRDHPGEDWDNDPRLPRIEVDMIAAGNQLHAENQAKRKAS